VKKGVQQIFSQIVPTYELINHLLTWGLDIHWRRRAARLAGSRQGSCWLDICTGTGEMAFNIAKVWAKNISHKDAKSNKLGKNSPFRISSGLSSLRLTTDERRKKNNSKGHLQSFRSIPALVVGLDFCWEMLHQARRSKTSRMALPLVFIQADVRHLPFAAGALAGVSISFATRNLGLTPETLLPFFREIYRVLRPGGLFINLETSQPRPAWLRQLFHTYVRFAVNSLGRKISGSKVGYAYLASTIPRFLSPEELSEVLQLAGFSRVKVIKLWLGVAAIHLAFKDYSVARTFELFSQ